MTMEVINLEEEEAKVPDFNVYVGAETGILKGVSINLKMNLAKNFTNMHSLERQHEITAMSWGSDDQSEIILGLRGQVVRTFNPEDKSFTSNMEVPGGSGRLVGVCRANDNLVTACESGLVQVWDTDRIKFDTIDYDLGCSGKLKNDTFEDEDAKEKHVATLKAGRSLCRMRQVPKNTNLIVTGGKENELQMWDLTKTDSGPVFRSKNVPLDSLQLRVPVWITDMCFTDNCSPDQIAIVTRYGHIRLYDTRGQQRRPVLGLEWKDEVLTAASATPVAHEILVGTASGHIGHYDLRMTHKGMKGKYRGCTGGIRSLDCHKSQSCFAAVGLDRCLRIFDINQTRPIQKMYLKSKLSQVLLTKEFDMNAIPKAEIENRKNKKIAKVGVTPQVVTVREEGDEFWAKLPVIRESKGKRSKQNDQQPASSAMSSKKSKK